MPESLDLTRLRQEYADREQRLKSSDLYSHFNPANLFLIHQRQRLLLRVLRRHGFEPLTERRILEVGCGGGGVLLEYFSFGAEPSCLFGVDLLPDRLFQAQKRLPLISFVCGDGQNLPYPAGTFDLVLQYTAFSSILDDSVKQKVAGEMVEVLRKPGGMIVWYDFWLNPTNKHTRGIRPGEIKRLFPNCQFEFHRITLAPPISRRMVPISWWLAYLVEKFKIFNTHYLVAIRPIEY